MSQPSHASEGVTPSGPDVRAFRRGIGRSVAMLAAFVVIYYALPVGELPSDAAIAVISFGGLLAGVVVLTLLAMAQIRHQIEAGHRPDVRIQSLLAIIYLAIALFASGYYALATSTADQMSGLETKTDALYFTMTTMATVGYGDVHALGQAARAIVIVHIAFNLAVIGALVSVLGTRIRERVARSQAGP
jgi:voltage-gated potassium channel